MESVRHQTANQFMKNKSTYIMLGAGLLLQLITFIITKDTWLAFISSIAGVFSVVFCSERRMSYYFWSFIQIFTFTAICWDANLYGKLVENAFYLITGVIGIVVWYKNRDNVNRVKTLSLNTDGIITLIISTVTGWAVLYIILGMLTDCQAPLLDSVSTAIAIAAQVLMMLRYRENWILWMIVDVICIVLFTITENWCMAVQYIFWMINTLYGYIQWSKAWEPRDKYFIEDCYAD